MYLFCFHIFPFLSVPRPVVSIRPMFMHMYRMLDAFPLSYDVFHVHLYVTNVSRMYIQSFRYLFFWI